MKEFKQGSLVVGKSRSDLVFFCLERISKELHFVFMLDFLFLHSQVVVLKQGNN
jgi:hypothetical protein